MQIEGDIIEIGPEVTCGRLRYLRSIVLEFVVSYFRKQFEEVRRFLNRQCMRGYRALQLLLYIFNKIFQRDAGRHHTVARSYPQEIDYRWGCITRRDGEWLPLISMILA